MINVEMDEKQHKNFLKWEKLEIKKAKEVKIATEQKKLTELEKEVKDKKEEIRNLKAELKNL